jgi:hypothetical protein
VGHRVIATCRALFADAVRATLPTGGVPVGVWDHRPENPAGPAIWCELGGVTWRESTWRVAVVATCLAGEGLEPGTAAAQRDALADTALSAARAIGAADAINARPNTVDTGAGLYPTIEVTATVVVSHCDPPTPIPTEAPNG